METNKMPSQLPLNIQRLLMTRFKNNETLDTAESDIISPESLANNSNVNLLDIVLFLAVHAEYDNPQYPVHVFLETLLTNIKQIDLFTLINGFKESGKAREQHIAALLLEITQSAGRASTPKAIELWAKAVSQNFAAAQYRLALMCETGIPGVISRTCKQPLASSEKPLFKIFPQL